MGLIVVLTLIVVILTLFKVIFKSKSPYKLPPGPRGLPLVGNIAQIIHNPHLKLSEWVKHYGPMFTINFGMKKTLVVSDVKLIKEVFSLPSSTGKYKTDTFLLASRGPHGVLNTDGDMWFEQRKFMLRSLVKHGFGNKTSLEPLILLEANEVIKWMKEEMARNGAVSPLDIFRIATNNTLLTLVTGDRVSLENSKVSKLLENLLDTMQYTVKSGLNFLPVLKYIAPSLSGYTALDKAGQDIHDFILGYFEEHKRTFVAGVERDLIDSYLEHMRTVTDPKSSFYGTRGEQNSKSSIVEIFNAGGETTPLTLDWLILYLCHNQEIQKKLHKEIDRVVGNRDPSVMDKTNMPYTEAVILETLRKSSLVPLGVIHELLVDVDFQDYRLPKGMLLVPNLYHAHHDPNVWEHPHEFRPERFLDETESIVVASRKENVVAFHPGRRVCLGEPLAKDVLFLFVIKLFQAFHISPDPASLKSNFEPDVGILLVAKPYAVVLKSRLLD